jgi:hypothetical protein
MLVSSPDGGVFGGSVSSSGMVPLTSLVPSINLLQYHRDLIRLIIPIERIWKEEWIGHFETLEKIIQSLENSVRKWKILLTADTVYNQYPHENQQQQMMNASASHLNENSKSTKKKSFSEEEDDAYCFTDPLSVSSTSSTFSVTDSTITESIAAVGVLGTIPAHLAHLASMQLKQVEIANRLLQATQSEYTLLHTMTNCCCALAPLTS